MNTSAHPGSQWLRRSGAVAVVGVVTLLLVMALASAARATESTALADQSQVVLSGRVDVPAGGTSDDVVVMHGAATVDGVVDGSVVVFDGPVTVNGEVTEDLVAFNGAVVVGEQARVGGDVVSPRSPQLAEGASIGGAVLRVRADWGLDSLAVTRFASWIAVSVSTLALGLLLVLFAPRAAEAAEAAVRTQPGAALAWGLAVAVGLPVIAVIAILTVVGIPFGVGLLLAFALLYSVGYVTVAWLIGRAVPLRFGSQIAAFLVGWLIVRALALVPFLDGLLWFPCAALGLGVLCAAAWSARRPAAVTDASAAPAAGAPA